MKTVNKLYVYKCWRKRCYFFAARCDT